jgi:hypothetical protein
MIPVTLDAGTVAKFENLQDLLELRDEDGRVIGYFHPVLGAQVARPQSPFDDAEIQRRRQQRAGRRLTDVLERLPQA